MLIKEVLDKTTQFFKEKKIDTARLDSEILISSALQIRRIDLYLKYDQPLKENEIQKCRDFVKRRASGEPVAYILEIKDFYKLEFFVDKRVLVPRPETEILVEKVLDWIEINKPILSTKINILDIGCGSGCIGLSLAKNYSNASVVLVDKSEQAIQVTKINAEKLNVDSQVTIVHKAADEIPVEENKFDIIVANPPYISKKDTDVQKSVVLFEPNEALFSEDNGLQDLFSWSRHAAQMLNKKAVMIFEIGHNQGQVMKKHFNELNVFDSINILKDYSGHDRFVIGEKLNG